MRSFLFFDAARMYASVAPPTDQRVSFGGRLAARITATAPEQWLLLTPSDDGPWLELRTVMVDRLSTPIDETGGPGTRVEAGVGDAARLATATDAAPDGSTAYPWCLTPCVRRSVAVGP